MPTILLILALIIVASLAFYAGQLLFKLRQQTRLQQQRRQDRVENITKSIKTIAMAMEQQQCNISEGAIRLCILLESLPINPLPDFAARFPALHDLYRQVKHMPTHEERQKQSRMERRKMDLIREELEAQMETSILKEVAILRHFSI
ncbi:DUF2489 domain-containing protein [Neptunicella sp.]|uniref:DUF2489 domain-containing protein n=1 Tax=Neptunicella sp. TaxID=2125986 RepID=UPI003F68D532